MKLKFIYLLFAFGTLLGCSKETDSLDDQAVNKTFIPSQERPFKIRSQGVFTTVDPTECAPLTQRELIGNGHSTHIGLFDADITWCTDLASQTYLIGTLTAANGDSLHFYSVGFGQSQEGQYGDYVFDGGTGRFASCYGEIRIYTTVIFTSENNGTYSNHGEGYLIY